MIVATGDHETSEVRLLPAADPLATPLLVRPREKGVEYDVDEREGVLYIHANDTHENFRLATAPLASPAEWTTLIEGTDAFYLTGFELFRDFYLIEGRLAGLDRLEVRYYDDPARIEPVEFPEESYTAAFGNNPEWRHDRAARRLRDRWSARRARTTTTSPTRQLALLKVQEIPSGYDKALYATERLEIAARDGTLIPVCDHVPHATAGRPAPLHLYGYGAYGIAIEPGFSTTRLSLVDRGFAYAIAHIRGGDDLGRAWYKAGKLERRTNTFTDFVDVAQSLIERGYTEAGKISISGGSAGGELMGAVINSDPDAVGRGRRARAVRRRAGDDARRLAAADPGRMARVGQPDRGPGRVRADPLVLALTTTSARRPIRRYSSPPGSTIRAVTYWEPAKWVARLRERKTDGNELLLKTNMGAGHGGKSGRFESLKETAEEFAFILWQMGVER